MSDASGRIRIAVYYAVWATLCAAAAGVVVALIHTWFFSYNPGKSAVMHTLFGGIVTALAIAAGQGAVALVTGSVLAQLGRTLNVTVLLGLLIGVFDFVMYFLQMAVPATELGWIPDIVILVAVTVLITALGSKRTVGQETPRRQGA
jgi:predicted membrane-bound spermidine synthase